MAESITEDDIISEWTIAVEALDIASIQQLIELRPNLLWTPLKNSSHLESDFDHFIQRLTNFKLLGTSIRPVYALQHILFDFGLPGDEWMNERVELIDFILKNTQGDELNTCRWGKEENTTMHLVVLLNQPELEQQLLDEGALISIPNKLGNLPEGEEKKEKEDDKESNSENIKGDNTEETNTKEPTLIISKKEKQQVKEKIPLNASDKFKRLRELAESPGNLKKTAERQNSTRRYFRPGHLEERKRRVLSEEEEAELEKQRLLRQKDIALLTQRSAVKNNPLFKKFEEQKQQVQERQYKPNSIRSAASIMRDRRKLLNPADQIKRSSRVINSLKENSYVTSSIFRQQAAQPESTLIVPKLRSRAPSPPISNESTPNTSDNEEEIFVNVSEDKKPNKNQDNNDIPPTMGEKSKVPEIIINSEMNMVDRDVDITNEQPTKRVPSALSPELEENNVEPLSMGRLKSADFLKSKSANKTSVDIATSKVKEIINVHEHLNDQEEIEIYSTGKVFTVWKKENDGDESEESSREFNKKQLAQVIETSNTIPEALVQDSTLSDKALLTPTQTTYRTSDTGSAEMSDDSSEELSEADDNSTYPPIISKLKFGRFEDSELQRNEIEVNRLEFNNNERDDSNNHLTQVNRLDLKNFDEFSDTVNGVHQKGKLFTNELQEEHNAKDSMTGNRLQSNRSVIDEESKDTSSINKLSLEYDRENDRSVESTSILNSLKKPSSNDDNKRNIHESDMLDFSKDTVTTKELDENEQSMIKIPTSTNKLDILDQGLKNSKEDGKFDKNFDTSQQSSIETQNDISGHNTSKQSAKGNEQFGKTMTMFEQKTTESKEAPAYSNKSNIYEQGVKGSEANGQFYKSTDMHEQNTINTEKDSVSINKLNMYEQGRNSEEDERFDKNVGIHEQIRTNSEDASISINKLNIYERDMSSREDEQFNKSVVVDEQTNTSIEKSLTATNNSNIHEHGANFKDDESFGKSVGIYEQSTANLERTLFGMNKIHNRGMEDGKFDKTLNMFKQNITDSEDVPIHARKLNSYEQGSLSSRETAIQINSIDNHEQSPVKVDGDILDANEMDINKRGFVESEETLLFNNKLSTLDRDIKGSKGDPTSVNDLDAKERHSSDIQKWEAMNLDQTSMRNAEASSLNAKNFSPKSDSFGEPSFDHDSFLDDEPPSRNNRHSDDDSTSDATFEDASRGSMLSFNGDRYSTDMPNSKHDNSQMEDIEFDDHIRFDDDEDIRSYQPNKVFINNFSTESLVDKDIPSRSATTFTYQDTTYDHTHLQHRPYEPYDHTIPISTQTVLEEEYESDEDGAKTPTPATPASQWPYEHQTPFDHRFSTSSSVNETSILNTLQNQRAQERWSQSEDEHWYDPADGSASSRNSSNYSFKHSNSTDTTRMDSSDEDVYYRKREHDTVMEEKAIMMQEEEDEDYYSTALHQRDHQDNRYGQRTYDNEAQETETHAIYNTPPQGSEYGQRAYDAPQAEDHHAMYNTSSQESIPSRVYQTTDHGQNDDKRPVSTNDSRCDSQFEEGDGEIVVFMDSSHKQLLSPPQPLTRVPSMTNTIYAVGQELEVVPHDPQHPRIEDISHYLQGLRQENGVSAFDEDSVMVKRAKSANEGASVPLEVPPAHEMMALDKQSMDVSGYGKMYIGVSGAHHVLLPLPKEITYVRIVISDGEYEYMSRYEILTQQILMDYECVIDTKPGMVITVSLHVRPDYHVRPKTGWSRWFTSVRKQKEHLSGYVYPEDGAIGQTRFAVDHMIPGCYKKSYQANFDCFNSWYTRTYQEKARREKFGDEEDFLKIVGKLNVEMLYLPVSSPSVQAPRSLRECDLTLKICQWHETCWQSGDLSIRKQGNTEWEKHYYRLIGSQLVGYVTEDNGRTRQVYNHFNIADVIRLSAATDEEIPEKGFFRLTFHDYHLDCMSDTIEENEDWVKTLKSMIGHVQRFHSILDGIKNIF